jgi:hypothetical protein
VADQLLLEIGNRSSLIAWILRRSSGDQSWDPAGTEVDAMGILKVMLCKCLEHFVRKDNEHLSGS